MALNINTNEFPILNHTEAQAWDDFSIQKKGVESRLLMGWAGYSVFLHLLNSSFFRRAETIHLLAGPGNNGGDGYVILWHILSAFNKKAIIWQLKPPVTEDSVYYCELCLSLKDIREIECRTIDNFSENMDVVLQKNDVVIDALFGSGLNKEPSALLQTVFSSLNGLSDIIRIAVDISSGVFAGGDVFNHTVFDAHYTYTFGSYKIGHLLEPGIMYSGNVHLFPIGFFPMNHPARRFLNEIPMVSMVPMIPMRKQGSHKYSSGIVTVFGGSSEMEGAAIMAARAFGALGGGLMRIVSTSPVISNVLNESPEYMVSSVSTISEAEDKVLNIIEGKKREQVLIIGPGLREEVSLEFWNRICNLENLHIIIDGSALSKLSKVKSILQNHSLVSLTLTPHKEEARKLLLKEVTNIREAALNISKEYNANVYLKGPGGLLIFADDREEIYVNSKHFELAVGGTGDVLTGVLANSILRMGYKKGIEAGLHLYLKAANDFTETIGKKSDGTVSVLKKDFLQPSDLMDQLRKTWKEGI
ncbi:MAG: NAD(P)H-hydrate dehydratase [Leptospirales bacterium]